MNTKPQSTPASEPPSRLYKQQSPRKLWVQTRGIKRYKRQDTHNYNVDRSFMSLLSKVKVLYHGTKQEAFEVDTRTDSSLNLTGMHTFCTPDLYLELECGYDLCCVVSYDFERCRYKEQVLHLLNSIYPLAQASKHQPLKGGVHAFFKRVKALHPTERFSRL